METPNKLVVKVGDALATECQAIFGSTWGNDVRWRLAVAALRVVPDIRLRELDILLDAVARKQIQ
jgi:hypothetical protein